MTVIKNKVGNKYGKLTVVKMLPNYNNTNQMYCLCNCDCGTNDYITRSSNLSYVNGKTKSCGCLKNSHSKWDNNIIQKKLDDLYNGEYQLIDENYINSKVKMNYIHTKCGNSFPCTLSVMYKTNFVHCPYCSSMSIIKGINDLWTLRPDVANLLENKELGYKIGIYDKEKINYICPYCKTINKKTTHTITQNGLSCKACSDGISFPNKVIYHLLNTLQEDFEREFVFKWLPRKPYDIVIENKKIIIEMDGGLGHGNRNITNDSTLNYGNDIIKNQKAIDNGYHIIRINCDYKDHDRNDYIKTNILKELSDYYDLSEIIWDKIFILSETNLFKAVINDFNNGMYKCDIANKYDINRNTVSRYIKRGEKLKLCFDDKRKKLINKTNKNYK